MRIQYGVTGATLRLTNDDVARLARELPLLDYLHGGAVAELAINIAARSFTEEQDRAAASK